MMDNNIPDEWYFITAPQDVSWSKEGSANIVESYGTNSPYLQYSATGMRQLKLGKALMEGFSAGKEVESNVRNLEACMRMVLDGSSGYTAPYVWRAMAGGKSYGQFIITNVSVQEEMRDMNGRATRALVDIDLQEVPDYQVASGIDLASRATAVSRSPDFPGIDDGKSQDAAVEAANAGNGGTTGGGGGGGSSSPPAGGETPPAVDPTQPILLDGLN